TFPAKLNYEVSVGIMALFLLRMRFRGLFAPNRSISASRESIFRSFSMSTTPRSVQRVPADPYDRSLLRTVHLVPLTAYDAAGKLALEVQKRHSARMSAAGIRVFLPAAGTSEFHSLSADEIVEIVRATRQGAGPEAQIFAPVGLQVQHAIDVGRRSL